ncbi:hypothetical protein FRX31_012709 [Thalictrum thalictroides]|uniref:Uncharacterized protein n=1 Tax=Thalictrum thalictroides TaxID=46969 RepID=A0A7J6WJZ7_THATH|nr:hypothetical protein FRX31_012709 [Thalictrum thalictroides]
MEVNHSFGCCNWKGIMVVKEKFIDGVAYNLGMGNIIRFWEDKWCGESILKEDFPAIYLRARMKHGTIADHWKVTAEHQGWNLGIRERVYEWETAQVDNLRAKLEGVQLSEEEDTMR